MSVRRPPFNRDAVYAGETAHELRRLARRADDIKLLGGSFSGFDENLKPVLIRMGYARYHPEKAHYLLHLLANDLLYDASA